MNCEHGIEGIRFLTIDDIVEINDLVLKLTPDEIKGIKDQAILESSQQSPSCHRYYAQTDDIFALAAVLGASLAKNHAFHNGNKRTAAKSVVVFLALNGWELTAPGDETITMYVGIVCNEYSREEFADWLAGWSREYDSSNLN